MRDAPGRRMKLRVSLAATPERIAPVERVFIAFEVRNKLGDRSRGGGREAPQLDERIAQGFDRRRVFRRSAVLGGLHELIVDRTLAQQHFAVAS